MMSSCSSNDEGGGGDTGSNSITISSDVNTVEVGESFNFTVKDNDNNDVTSSSTIYVDDTAISGSVFTPNEEGTYEVYATYQELTTETITLTATASNVLTSISVVPDQAEVLVGEQITFSVVGNNGEDFTDDATIYVDGVALEGNTFVSDERGVFEAYADYEDFTSENESVLVGHTKKVLIEDYTGAWCGWCPRVAYGIELVEQQTDNAVVVAIHRGASSGSYYDPFNYPAEALENLIGLEGYPTAKINRMLDWAYPEPNNVAQVISQTNGVSKYGLELSSELNGSTLDVSVKMSFLGENADDKKLVVYVLEDGLVQDQTNYTNYYGGSAVLQDFVHDNVLRQVPTGLLGENIAEADFDTDSNAYVKDYSFALSGNIEDTNNLSVVAFVISNNTNFTLNSQKAAVGETKAFD